MSLLPNTIYGFHVNPNRNHWLCLSSGWEKMVLKYVWKHRTPRVSKDICVYMTKKESESPQLDFRKYLCIVFIRKAQCWHKDMYQCIRKQSREVIYSTWHMSWNYPLEKWLSHTNIARKIGCTHTQVWKHPFLTPHTKLNSIRIKGLNLYVIKLPEENTENSARHCHRQWFL